jgi:hydrogenase maturation protease
MKILVLGLGNDLIADDGVGIIAARHLRDELSHIAVVEETSECGLALLECFIGYDYAIVVDAIKTGNHPPGTIQHWVPADLDALIAPSPHYTGLPELISLAEQMDLDYPQEIKIISMEAEDTYTIGSGLTDSVKDALPKLEELIMQQVMEWYNAESLLQY